MTIDEGTRELMRLTAQTMRQNADAILALIDSDGATTRYYDAAGYAARFDIPASTVRRRLLSGEIPGAFKQGRSWVIPVKETA